MSNTKNKEMEKTILIVDDEAAVRRSLSLGLNQQGYNNNKRKALSSYYF